MENNMELMNSFKFFDDTTKSNISTLQDVDSIMNCRLLIEKDMNSSFVGGESTEHSEDQHHQNTEEDIMRIDIRSSNSYKGYSLSHQALEDDAHQIHSHYAASERAASQFDEHVQLASLITAPIVTSDKAARSPSASAGLEYDFLRYPEGEVNYLKNSPQESFDMA